MNLSLDETLDLESRSPDSRLGIWICCGSIFDMAVKAPQKRKCCTLDARCGLIATAVTGVLMVVIGLVAEPAINALMRHVIKGQVNLCCLFRFPFPYNPVQICNMKPENLFSN